MMHNRRQNKRPRWAGRPRKDRYYRLLRFAGRIRWRDRTFYGFFFTIVGANSTHSVYFSVGSGLLPL